VVQIDRGCGVMGWEESRINGVGRGVGWRKGSRGGACRTIQRRWGAREGGGKSCRLQWDPATNRRMRGGQSMQREWGGTIPPFPAVCGAATARARDLKDEG
jgi:hypothetical protein